MRKPLAIGAATLALVLTLGLAACGSDNESDDTLDRSELIAQADQICTDYNEQLQTATEESDLTTQSSDAEVTAFISDEVVPHYENLIGELRDLNPDDESADQYNELLDTLESDVGTVADDPQGAFEGGDPFADASAQAKAFGLEVCGSN